MKNLLATIALSNVLMGCGGRAEIDEAEFTNHPSSIDSVESESNGGQGGAPSGSCSGTITMVEVPENHCIEITGNFDPTSVYEPGCLQLQCEDLPRANVSLWRGWGDAVRYVHHIPECGDFEYEITEGACGEADDSFDDCQPGEPLKKACTTRDPLE